MQSHSIHEEVAEGSWVSGLGRLPDQPARDAPLIVAIHGGSYTSRYFDIGANSLLGRGASLGMPILALDRPGYGRTTPLPPADSDIAHNAERLDRALACLYERPEYGRTAGVVLVGHSIGAAVAVGIASRRPRWPLLGIAISGIGLHPPPEVGAAWSSLPDISMVSVPPEAKDALMFGPAWTHEPDFPASSRVADAPTPRAELIDVVAGWPRAVHELAAAVTVPVHYRQAEFEKLWVVSGKEINDFAAAFSSAPFVDAGLFDGTGHCIDFHRVGPAFQLEQLAFALRCCARRSRPGDM